MGVKSVMHQKKKKYNKTIAENILKRDFYAMKPNEKWATDVTEFKIIGISEKLYLSAIIDLYDRGIVINPNKLVRYL